MAQPTPPIALRLSRVLILLFGILFATLSPAFASLFNVSVKATPPVQSVAAPLTKIGAHEYELRIAADEFAKVVIRQLGTDIVVGVQSQDGNLSVDAANGSAGREEVLVIGSARLKIAPRLGQLAASPYQIIIEEQRPSTGLDRRRLAAQRAFFEGEDLRRPENRELLELAVRKYSEAIETWRELGNQRWIALALRCRGATYFYLNMTAESLASYDEALAILRQLPERLDEAGALLSLAITQLELGDSINAIANFQLSLQLFKDVRDEKFIGRTLSQLGRASYLLGDLKQALDFYDEALPIRQQHEPSGEAFTLLGIGRVYANGFVDYEKALGYYRNALEYVTPGSYTRLSAQLFGDIGKVYYAQNNFDAALAEYQKAINEKPDARVMAEILMYVGLVYAAKQNHNAALSHFHNALVLQCKSIDEAGTAATLSNYQRESCDVIGAAHTLKNIGLSYSALGKHDQALTRLNQALQIWTQILYRTAEADTRYEIAGVQKRLGKFAEARQQLEAALPTIELLRSKITNQHLRTSYFASAQKFYELYIDVLMRQYDQTKDPTVLARALTYSERARTRSMLDTLIEAQAEIRNGAKAEDLQKEAVLQNKLTILSQRHLIDPRQSESEKARIRMELSVLVAEYHTLEARIRESSPRYAGLAYPEPLSAEAMQQLLEPDQMLLEFALGDERSYLWAVTRQSIRSFELPKRAELERDSDEIRKLLNERSPEYEKAASRLCEKLFAPVNLSTDTPRLLIVPAGRLQYLPFTALPVPVRGTQPAYESIVAGKQERVPLLVYHEIETLPSVSVLAQLKKERRSRESSNRKQVIVIADPVFELLDDRFRFLSRGSRRNSGSSNSVKSPNRKAAAGPKRSSDDNPQRLVFSAREATAILAALGPGMAGDKVLSFQANKEFVTTAGQLSHYRIVHFATHGRIDDVHPVLSNILLSLFDDRGRQREGILPMHEIYNLSIPADMVVLSACDTAIGKEMKGEGLPGLSRAFIYAGARRVVASLWQVRDDSTAELMGIFYRKLFQQNGVRPAAALREAQLEMWKKAPSRSPHRWAAFITYGDSTY